MLARDNFKANAVYGDRVAIANNEVLDLDEVRAAITT